MNFRMAKTASKEESNPFSVLGDALESAADTFEEATTTASSSAKKAAGSAKRAFYNGVHKTAYYSSYGVVYATVFLTELWPNDNPWRVGLEEGAAAALEERQRVRAIQAEKKASLESVEKEAAAEKVEPEVKAEPAPVKAKRGRKPKPKAPKAAETRAAAFESASNA